MFQSLPKISTSLELNKKNDSSSVLNSLKSANTESSSESEDESQDSVQYSSTSSEEDEYYTPEQEKNSLNDVKLAQMRRAAKKKKKGYNLHDLLSYNDIILSQKKQRMIFGIQQILQLHSAVELSSICGSLQLPPQKKRGQSLDIILQYLGISNSNRLHLQRKHVEEISKINDENQPKGRFKHIITRQNLLNNPSKSLNSINASREIDNLKNNLQHYEIEIDNAKKVLSVCWEGCCWEYLQLIGHPYSGYIKKNPKEFIWQLWEEGGMILPEELFDNNKIQENQEVNEKNEGRIMRQKELTTNEFFPHFVVKYNQKSVRYNNEPDKDIQNITKNLEELEKNIKKNEELILSNSSYNNILLYFSNIKKLRDEEKNIRVYLQDELIRSRAYNSSYNSQVFLYKEHLKELENFTRVIINEVNGKLANASSIIENQEKYIRDLLYQLHRVKEQVRNYIDCSVERNITTLEEKELEKSRANAKQKFKSQSSFYSNSSTIDGDLTVQSFQQSLQPIKLKNEENLHKDIRDITQSIKILRNRTIKNDDLNRQRIQCHVQEINFLLKKLSKFEESNNILEKKLKDYEHKNNLLYELFIRKQRELIRKEDLYLVKNDFYYYNQYTNISRIQELETRIHAIKPILLTGLKHENNTIHKLCYSLLQHFNINNVEDRNKGRHQFALPIFQPEYNDFISQHKTQEEKEMEKQLLEAIKNKSILKEKKKSKNISKNEYLQHLQNNENPQEEDQQEKFSQGETPQEYQDAYYQDGMDEEAKELESNEQEEYQNTSKPLEKEEDDEDEDDSEDDREYEKISKKKIILDPKIIQYVEKLSHLRANFILKFNEEALKQLSKFNTLSEIRLMTKEENYMKDLIQQEHILKLQEEAQQAAYNILNSAKNEKKTTKKTTKSKSGKLTSDDESVKKKTVKKGGSKNSSPLRASGRPGTSSSRTTTPSRAGTPSRGSSSNSSRIAVSKSTPNLKGKRK